MGLWNIHQHVVRALGFHFLHWPAHYISRVTYDISTGTLILIRGASAAKLFLSRRVGRSLDIAFQADTQKERKNSTYGPSANWGSLNEDADVIKNMTEDNEPYLHWGHDTWDMKCHTRSGLCGKQHIRPNWGFTLTSIFSKCGYLPSKVLSFHRYSYFVNLTYRVKR